MESESLEPAVEYLKNIDEDDQVAIIHHWDMDGTSSSVIISKILEKLRGCPADEVTIPAKRAYHLSDEDRQMLEDKTKILILDFNLAADELEDLNENYGDVLVVDHHNFDRVPDVPFVNPREADADAYVPCSKICLDIASNFGLEDDLRWIAGLGVIQDFGVSSCKDLFEDLEEDYEAYLPETLEQQELAKNCEYGRYSSVLNIKPYRDSAHFAKLAYQALMSSNDLKELEAQEAYRKIYEVYLEMQDEFNIAVEDYDEDREIDRQKMVIFFELESDFHITSSIATNMSAKTPEWIHLVVQRGEEINVSARCQSGRVDLGELMQEALPEESLEDGAEAGGHRKAAGASMQPEYYEEFKDNFKHLI
ncbi:DHH family phosphoesterase [Candidatus Nanohalococcus occultus]|uniref:DHH superfamily phosphohydrolase/exonuclease n=1 Tax=Candidatus Nanohalococcus occultus TaxID=2978047 RepID=A0ABY8CI70_9ARCH|nr:DHH superfamily phosphohydrolase/exonuclease [Candidatus Nanohaloarchaeota archaeon SVXNc]